MLKKVIIMISFLFIVFSLSMCKNIFSAISEPVPVADQYRIYLPRTGLTKCYKEDGATGEISCTGSRQDGEIQAGAELPVPRFIDNGNGTMTDRLTGLMWEKLPDNSAHTWVNAFGRIAALNSQKLGGYSDWRLPNVLELKSIINYAHNFPAQWLKDQGFETIILTSASNYWSSTTTPSDSGQAYYAIFYSNSGGQIKPITKTNSYYVIAVRGRGHSGAIRLPRTGQASSIQTGDDGQIQAGAPLPHPRFIDNGNGTMTDRLTGLMWEKMPYNGTLQWAAALNHCRTLTTGGYSDWRLPNVHELISLVNYGYSGSQSAWLISQGFSGIQTGRHWTSNTELYSTNSARYLAFSDVEFAGNGKTNLYYVLAVRGGK